MIDVFTWLDAGISPVDKQQNYFLYLFTKTVEIFSKYLNLEYFAKALLQNKCHLYLKTILSINSPLYN